MFTPLTVLLEYWLADVNGWNEYLVTGINMLLNFVTEFLYQRFFVFGMSIDTAVKNNKGPIKRRKTERTEQKKSQEKSLEDNVFQPAAVLP